LRVHVNRPDVGELMGSGSVGSAAEPTAAVAARVAAARELARGRGFAANADIPGRLLDRLVPLGRGAERLFEQRLRQGRLSARGMHRARRVARTVADLSGWPGPVREEDVQAALALRSEVFPSIQGLEVPA
jgi:magnesium chelatase family protein